MFTETGWPDVGMILLVMVACGGVFIYMDALRQRLKAKAAESTRWVVVFDGKGGVIASAKVSAAESGRLLETIERIES